LAKITVCLAAGRIGLLVVAELAPGKADEAGDVVVVGDVLDGLVVGVVAAVSDLGAARPKAHRGAPGVENL